MWWQNLPPCVVLWGNKKQGWQTKPVNSVVIYCDFSCNTTVWTRDPSRYPNATHLRQGLWESEAGILLSQCLCRAVTKCFQNGGLPRLAFQPAFSQPKWSPISYRTQQVRWKDTYRFLCCMTVVNKQDSQTQDHSDESSISTLTDRQKDPIDPINT